MNMADKKQSANDFDFVPGAPARRALANAGYTRLEQFTKITEAELLKLHGMGPRAMAVIKEAMKVKGLSFKRVDKKSKQTW